MYKTAVKDKMDIPGFEGRYFVKSDGTVWKYADPKRKEHRIYGNRRNRSIGMTLMGHDGKDYHMTMAAIMKKTYFKGKVPDGYSLMHLNGMQDDYSVWNLKPISKQELGKISFRHNDARSVIKIDPKNWKRIAIYKSAAEASRKTVCCESTIRNACNKKNVNRPGIAPDGYYYQWEE